MREEGLGYLVVGWWCSENATHYTGQTRHVPSLTNNTGLIIQRLQKQWHLYRHQWPELVPNALLQLLAGREIEGKPACLPENLSKSYRVWVKEHL